MEIKNIIKVLADVLEIDENMLNWVTEDTSLIGNGKENSLNLSSIDYVDFLSSIEAEYNVMFDLEQDIRSIVDVVNIIRGKNE